MCCSEGCQHVCPDLVGRIAIGGDSIGSGDDHVDLAPLEVTAGSPVANHLHRDPLLLQFPCGDTGSLKQRPGFIGENAESSSGFPGGIKHRKRGSRTGSSQSPGIAMGDDRSAFRNDICSRPSNSITKVLIFLIDGLCQIE